MKLQNELKLMNNRLMKCLAKSKLPRTKSNNTKANYRAQKIEKC